MTRKRHQTGPSPSYLAKSLEALEGQRWGEPTYGSYVVTTSHALRTKPLQDLTDEELRLALSQQLGLPWMLELALQRLEQDPLRAGDFYPGDVLAAALRLPGEAWDAISGAKERLAGIVAEAERGLVLSGQAFSSPLDEVLRAFRA